MCFICGRKNCSGKVNVKVQVAKWFAMTFTFAFFIMALWKLLSYFDSIDEKTRLAKFNGEYEEVFNAHTPISRDEVIFGCIEHYGEKYPTSKGLNLIYDKCEKLVPQTGNFEVATARTCSFGEKCRGFKGYLFLSHKRNGENEKHCTAYYVK